jgi:hypothetical protein
MSLIILASSASAGLLSQSNQLLGISLNSPPKESETATVLLIDALSEMYWAAAVMPASVRSTFAITILASGAIPPGAKLFGFPAAIPATMFPWFSEKTGKLETILWEAAITPVWRLVPFGQKFLV